jgi:4-amino-4-deoxy-L-arabinose transferase-like glycosyltransferase
VAADPISEPVPESATLPRLERGLLLGLSAAKLLIHAALSGRYGYFRDELYFLDCGRHLDWGYVDHAPMIGLVAKVALLLGGSLHVLRLIPAVAGALLVALTVVLARELGGRRFAQGLAGLAVIAAPIYLGTDSLLTMNAFEPLFWMGCVWALVRIVRGGDPRLWLVFGALAGLGLMNKHSTVFFGAAVAAALLLVPERRQLRTAWPWIGAGLALLVFLPNLVWQVRHDFATLEDLRNVARSGKNVRLGPAEFVLQQVVILHPVLFPLWIGGLAWLFRGRGGRFRILAWIYVVLFVMLVALKAKNYYLAPIYPMLFAAGAVGLEEALDRRTTRGRIWPKAAVVAVIVAAGLVVAPVALPLLPPERYVAYEKALGFGPPKTEVAHRGPLPQIFGDQFGWPELVAEVAGIYRSLPSEERARTGIFANNYGEAGAVALFGPRYGLPRPISAHQSYFLWGPGSFDGDALIVLQDDRESLERVCRSVEQAGVHDHPWGMAEENNPIFVCRGLKVPLRTLWPRLKKWN